MPEIDFDPMNKRVGSDSLEFDRLKLKKDERARIVLLEKPTFAYCHTLKKPKLVNGRPVKVEKETRKGDTYIDFDMDFVGRPLCLGDYGIIADTGLDEKNCPACKRSLKTDEINAPERRFAMNVIRYGMTRDGKLVKPFKCDNVVWGFTETTFNRLIEIANEHGSLIGSDFLLGPCTNEPYQKFEIQVGKQSLWQTDEGVKATVQATYQENRIEELERACGRKAEVKWLVKDLDSIAEGWRLARGDSDPTAIVGGSRALDDGLAALVGNQQQPVDMAGLLNFNAGTDEQDNTPPGFGEVLGQGQTPDNVDFGDVLNGLR